MVGAKINHLNVYGIKIGMNIIDTSILLIYNGCIIITLKNQ